MIGDQPLCIKCKHLFKDTEPGYRCSAYPNGIPIEIIAGYFEHTEPYPDDGGIQFEPAEARGA